MIAKTKAQESAVKSFEDDLYALYVKFINQASATGMDTRDREIALGRYLTPLGRRFPSDRHSEAIHKR